MIYDVIVVGGGPAGSVLAYELAQRGLEVLILEKATLPRYKACGGGLTRKTVQNLHIAYPGDGAAEADQLFAVHLICSSEGVDDFCDGLFGDGMPFIVGELVVFNDGSVFVFS